MAAKHKSVETKWYEKRDELMHAVRRLNRRDFFKVMGAAGAVTAAKGLLTPHSFQLVEVAHADSPKPEKFSFAYVSDTHLYSPKLNDQFIKSAIRAVDDVNRLDPQPDFVLFGGDLAQLGAKEELEIGRQILKDLKAPVRMMVGEHDWFLDLGDTWKENFGKPTYSFDHKGVHFVVLMSVYEKDFWTKAGLTPDERMHIVAGLDNGRQSRFEVGGEQRAWLAADLKNVPNTTPLVVFSHSTLYKYYRDWNFWTEDADEVQAILRPFQNVTVIHGHTHQVLNNRIGNINFHGLLSTAWPWPYAPEGLPKLTVAMNRANPFDPNDGCGDGVLNVGADGLVDMVYNLWDRNPVTVSATYLKSQGRSDRPAATTLKTF
jgi:Icc protein